MDGRGRVTDNIFIERLWRSVKCGEIYVPDYMAGVTARQGLAQYFRFYNTENPTNRWGTARLPIHTSGRIESGTRSPPLPPWGGGRERKDKDKE
jgi:transposase InsO family protein